MGEFRDMFDELDKLFDLGIVKPSFMNLTDGLWKPPVDVYETPEEILIYMEIPGVDKPRFKVSYHDGQLTITGHREQLLPEELVKIHRMEIDTGKFLRRMKIDMEIREEEIEAEYNDGFLRIRIPKRSG